MGLFALPPHKDNITADEYVSTALSNIAIWDWNRGCDYLLHSFATSNLTRAIALQDSTDEDDMHLVVTSASDAVGEAVKHIEEWRLHQGVSSLRTARALLDAAGDLVADTERLLDIADLLARPSLTIHQQEHLDKLREYFPHLFS